MVFRLIGDGGVMGASKTIIVSRTDKIGDFVVSIPSFATLKAMCPDYKIVALVGKPAKLLASSLPCIDEVVCFDDYDFETLAERLRAYEPEAFIALVVNWPIMRLVFKSGAPIRIGPWSKPMSFFIFNRGVYQKRSRCIKSEAMYNLELIEHYNPKLYEQTGIRFEQIRFTPDDEQEVVTYLKAHQLQDESDNSTPFILINPLTGGSGCNLSIKDYGRLINSIFKKAPSFSLDDGLNEQDTTKQHPLPHIIVLGIPAQEPELQVLMDSVEEPYKNHCHLFINQKSLLVAAALVHKCKVFIGPSTGVTQIAGNYKKSAVCFYSTRLSNSHTRWALFGDNNEVPFTFDLEKLDPETKVLKILPDTTLQAIVSTTLEEFFHSETLID